MIPPPFVQRWPLGHRGNGCHPVCMLLLLLQGQPNVTNQYVSQVNR